MIRTVGQNLKKLWTFNLLILISFVWEHGINKLIIMPFLARHLGEARFGSFVLAMSLVLFLATMIPSGLLMTNYRENAKFNQKEKQELFDTIFTLLMILTTGIAILYILSRNSVANFFDDGSIATFMPFLGGYLVCYVLLNFGKHILVINLKFNVKIWFDLIYGSMICLLIPGYFIFGDAGVAAGYFLGALIAVVSITSYLRRQQLIFTLRIVKSKMKTILETAPTFTLAAAALTIMTVADRWIVGAFWPETQVTYYYVSIQVATLFVLPFSLLNSVLNPIVTKRGSLNNFTRSEIKIFLFVLAGSIFLVLVCGSLLGPWVIRILYGANILSHSRIPFNIVLVGQLFYLVRIYSQPFLMKFFPPDLSRRIQWVSAALFMILHLVLVPRYGIIGGGIATALAFALMGALCFKYVVLEIRHRVFYPETP